MTPHIKAHPGEIAEIVLTSGDPLRIKFIAENFLTHSKLVSDVRNNLIYTGKYQGVRLTVAASGMGMPSAAIYITELFRFYGVNKIIRIGSAGALTSDLKVMDLLLATSAFFDNEKLAEKILGFKLNYAYPDQELNKIIINKAAQLHYNLHVGQIYTNELFYDDLDLVVLAKKKILAAEMETAMLFMLAQKYQRQAAALLTISDSLITKEEVDFKQREVSLTQMIEIALQAIV